MKKHLVALMATVALVAAAPATNAAPAASPVPTISKSCSGSYTHAVINGAHKCLRRGQYCSRSADSTYHKYGFHCHKRDSYGSYHLT